MRSSRRHQQGLTLIEVLVTLVLSAVLVVSVAGTMLRAADSHDALTARADRLDQARFVMARLTTALGRSERLLFPAREESASALAVQKDQTLDLDFDGQADSDNDGDGRVDEDPGADVNDDGEPGLAGVDDDGDGSVDEGSAQDDDEDGRVDEDPVDGTDNDGDGRRDEDPGRDWNGDGQPGEAGVDDNGDGNTDNGPPHDDDEDGSRDEDWRDTVVFLVDQGRLIERMPVPWDVDGNMTVTGEDLVDSVLAEDVSEFTVERLPRAAGAGQVVRIRLALAVPDDEPVELETRLRVGSGL